MAQEPTEAPTPDLGGFGKSDAGSLFAQRLKERQGQANGSSTPDIPAADSANAPQNTAATSTESASPPAPLKAPKVRNEDSTHAVKPTVLSVEESIVHRFEEARKDAPSHTGLILQALEAQYQALPQLIKDRRPKPAEGALFSFRPTPGEAVPERRLPIRIRPLVAELAVIDQLVEQCQSEVDSEVNRSEMIAAALDAHLPLLPKKRRKTKR